jgi:hypothetical protein
MRFKFVFFLLLTAIGRIAIAGDAAQVVNHFDLRTCYKDKCVKVEALKAESGAFTQILSLKNVYVTVVQGKVSTRYSAPYGFIDLDNKSGVFRISPKAELSLNLAEIKTVRFKL